MQTAVGGVSEHPKKTPVSAPGEYLVEFLNQPILVPSELDTTNITLSDAEHNLDKSEWNSLYYLAGYCVSKIKKHQLHCETCLASVETPVPLPSDVTKLTELKDYRGDCLVYVTEKVFDMIQTTELMLRGIEESSLLRSGNVKKVLLEKSEQLAGNIVLQTAI